jgi:hypothetical protein
MVKIFILTKRSIFLIVLVSNTINPLLASPLYTDSASQSYQERAISYLDIQNSLTSKGLQKEIAEAKVKKLFKEETSLKLAYLYKHPALALSKNIVIDTFAKQALFDKYCDLNSYDSLVGFVQSIHPNLDKKQLSAIKQIAKLS